MLYGKLTIVNNCVSYLVSRTNIMKPHTIKYILLILTTLPVITTADLQIPSGKAKQDFAQCVVNENNAWSDCYHHLHPNKGDTTENSNTEKAEPSTNYYAPRWVYRLLPTFNPPDYTQESSPWESDGRRTAANH